MPFTPSMGLIEAKISMSSTSLSTLGKPDPMPQASAGTASFGRSPTINSSNLAAASLNTCLRLSVKTGSSSKTKSIWKALEVALQVRSTSTLPFGFSVSLVLTVTVPDCVPAVLPQVAVREMISVAPGLTEPEVLLGVMKAAPVEIVYVKVSLPVFWKLKVPVSELLTTVSSVRDEGVGPLKSGSEVSQVRLTFTVWVPLVVSLVVTVTVSC